MDKKIFYAMGLCLVFGGLTLIYFRGLFLALTGFFGIVSVILLEKEDKKQRERLQDFKAENKAMYEGRLAQKFNNKRIGGNIMKKPKKVKMVYNAPGKIRLVKQ